MKTVKPILPCDDFFRIRDAINSRIYDMENREWAVLVGCGADTKTFNTLRKQIIELKSSLSKLGSLFESQYPKS
jgi:hypothetical protein